MASIVISGNTSGSVTLSAPAVAGSTTITMPTSTGNALVDVARLIANNGYVTLSNGLIIQYGNSSIAGDTRTVFSFPIAFPTACVGFGTGTDWVGANGWNPGGGMFISSTQYILYNVDATARSVAWIAMGY